jgi:hypothetical protein
MEKKECEKPQAYISLHCPDDLLHPIMTNFGNGGVIHKVIKRAKFGVDRLLGAGCAGS